MSGLRGGPWGQEYVKSGWRLTVSRKELWKEIKGIIFTMKTHMFMKFDSMESLVTLGRQIEAGIECWLLSEKLGREWKKAIAGNSTRLVDYFFGWEKRIEKNEIRYLREKGKLEEWELRRKNGGVRMSYLYMGKTCLSLSIKWGSKSVDVHMFACTVMGFKTTGFTVDGPNCLI